MKQTKRMKFLANMTSASNNPAVNPVPTLELLKTVLGQLKTINDSLRSAEWTLVSPDGRVWTGADPLTLAAKAHA